MIGPSYTSKATQAILGPAHSQLIPNRLWVGWLDASGNLIAMSGTYLAHTVFGPIADGVANISAVDCGIAGTGWAIAKVGLFDAAGGNLIVSCDLPSVASPTAGAPLGFAAGDLKFTVAA